MKKLFVLFIILFSLVFVSDAYLTAEATSGNVVVNVTGIFDSEETTFTMSPSIGYGSNVSIDISGAPVGQTFAFWIVNGIVRPDLAVDANIRITTKTELQVVFTPAGKVVAVFIDSNGRYLGSSYVVSGNPADDTSIGLPSRPGYVALTGASRWASIHGSMDAGNITQNSVFVQQYSVDGTPATVNLSITNGTGPASVDFNTVVTVSANTPVEGEVFSHWSENGIKVSQESSYSFSALYSRTLVANYVVEASAPALVPQVTLSNPLSLRTGYESYVGQFYLPDGYELVEYGYLVSNDGMVLTYDYTPMTVAQATNYNANTNEFITSFLNDSFESIRSYLIVKNGETISTFYSEQYFANATYTTGFEDGVKTSYATGNVTLSSVEWIFNDTLIGNLAGDKKNDTKSARIQGSGFIESVNPFEAVSMISLYTATYGTDGAATVSVSVSSDATNWVNVTDALGYPSISASGTLTFYNIVLSNSANYNASSLSKYTPLYIRVAKSGGNRVNVDDLKVYSQEVVYTDEMRVSTDKAALSLQTSFTSSGTLNLTSTGALNSTITWNFVDSEDPANSLVNLGNGAVTVVLANPTDVVNIVATIEYGTVTDTKVFEITVGKTDEQRVADDKTVLSIVTSVTEAGTITLPTTGTNGSSISWSSSNTTIITNDGTVVLPESTTNVTMTATISYGISSSDTKQFIVNVVAEDAPPSTTVIASYTGLTNGNMTDGNNASIIGLDSTIFNVTSIKGSNNLHVGLNSAGQIRLYYSTTTTKNMMTIAIASEYHITSVAIVFGATAGNTKVDLGDDSYNLSSHSNTTKTYNGLSISTFSISNVNTTNVQVYILSIEITYSVNP